MRNRPQREGQRPMRDFQAKGKCQLLRMWGGPSVGPEGSGGPGFQGFLEHHQMFSSQVSGPLSFLNTWPWWVESSTFTLKS